MTRLAPELRDALDDAARTIADAIGRIADLTPGAGRDAALAALADELRASFQARIVLHRGDASVRMLGIATVRCRTAEQALSTWAIAARDRLKGGHA